MEAAWIGIKRPIDRGRLICQRVFCPLPHPHNARPRTNRPKDRQTDHQTRRNRSMDGPTNIHTCDARVLP